MLNLFFVIHDYSGARTYANELLSWLSVQPGIVVHKVFFESSCHNEYTVVKDDNDIINVHIPAVERKVNTLKKYSQRCVDLMTPLLQGKTKVIFHLNWSTHVKLGIEARDRFGAHIVYTLHYLPNYFSSFFANPSVKQNEVTTTDDALHKEIVKEADFIICVTQFAREILRIYYSVPDTKTIVVYNGYSIPENDNFNPRDRCRLKNQLGFRLDDQIILFVGRVQQGKGVEKLIAAFNKLTDKYQNLRLVIVGEGEFALFMELCQDNFARISFTGKIPAEKVKQLYQIADIGVIPSKFEQCSYVALEMMQQRISIVCSDAPGLKELFEHKKSALLIPLKAKSNDLLGLEISSEEIFKVVQQLLEDSSLSQEIAQNAHAKWKCRYTAMHMGQSTIQVYQRLQNKLRDSAKNEKITIPKEKNPS